MESFVGAVNGGVGCESWTEVKGRSAQKLFRKSMTRKFLRSHCSALDYACVCVSRWSESYTNTQKLQCQHYPGSFEACVWFAYAGPRRRVEAFCNCTMQYLSEAM